MSLLCALSPAPVTGQCPDNSLPTAGRFQSRGKRCAMPKLSKSRPALLLAGFSLVCLVWTLRLTLGSNGPAGPLRLRCEYLSNPLGIDVREPRFSWALEH